MEGVETWRAPAGEKAHRRRGLSPLRRQRRGGRWGGHLPERRRPGPSCAAGEQRSRAAARGIDFFHGTVGASWATAGVVEAEGASDLASHATVDILTTTTESSPIASAMLQSAHDSLNALSWGLLLPVGAALALRHGFTGTRWCRRRGTPRSRRARGAMAAPVLLAPQSSKAKHELQRRSKAKHELQRRAGEEAARSFLRCRGAEQGGGPGNRSLPLLVDAGRGEDLGQGKLVPTAAGEASCLRGKGRKSSLNHTASVVS